MSAGAGQTVTLLLCTMEGGTALWERYPLAMPDLLAHYQCLVRRSVERHQGRLFKTISETCFCVFESAHTALAAALEVLRAKDAEVWGVAEKLLIRAILHTGALDRRNDDYIGLTLSRAQQLLAMAVGDQLLLSRVTHDLVCDQLPPGVSLRDLGLHLLGDLSCPEQIFQAQAPDLPAEFPTIKTLGARRAGLPPPSAALIGREDALRDLLALLREPAPRMVTLTGPGGVGQTRLALRTAELLLESFTGETLFLAPANLRSSAELLGALAAALGLSDIGEAQLAERLKLALRDRRLLLVLDSVEQLTAVAPLFAELLSAAPGLRMLITSRTALRPYELGDRQSGAVVLFNLGRAAAALGELPSAEGYYQRSLAEHQELGERRGIAFCLEGLAALLAWGDQPRPAARLYGAAEAIREQIGAPWAPPERAEHTPWIDRLRQDLGAETYLRTWQGGRRLSLEQVIAEAQIPRLARPAQLIQRSVGEPRRSHAPISLTGPGLTGREREVLLLMAEGLTDQEIADQLVLSVRTIHTHLRSIYKKLEVRSRTAAARAALEQGLV